VLLEHGVRFELVFGGIEEVQGETFGNLTLALDGDPAAVDAAVDAVRALVPAKELPR
jgi:D-methionine transport system ATP-binding protein